MTEFKAGDRVEYQNGIEEDPGNGKIGTVLGKSMYSTPSKPRVSVTWDDIKFPAFHPLTGHLRPAKPQKATPKAGDVVRVMLEGRASMINKDEESFHIGWNVVHGDSNHVRSIEIIAPAKPSVADLPVGSVVRVATNFYTRIEADGEYAWRNPLGHLTPHSSLDKCDWVQLVEKES